AFSTKCFCGTAEAHFSNSSKRSTPSADVRSTETSGLNFGLPVTIRVVIVLIGMCERTSTTVLGGASLRSVRQVISKIATDLSLTRDLADPHALGMCGIFSGAPHQLTLSCPMHTLEGMLYKAYELSWGPTTRPGYGREPYVVITLPDGRVLEGRIHARTKDKVLATF